MVLKLSNLEIFWIGTKGAGDLIFVLNEHHGQHKAFKQTKKTEIKQRRHKENKNDKNKQKCHDL